MSTTDPNGPALTAELDGYAASELRTAAVERAAESMRWAADELAGLAESRWHENLENAQSVCAMVRRDLDVIDQIGWPDAPNPDRPGVLDLDSRR